MIASLVGVAIAVGVHSALTWASISFLSERVGLLERTFIQMVTRTDFDAAMLAAHTAMNDLARRVDVDLKAKDDALAAKDATIADLQAQLAAAVPLTEDDLTGVQALALNANAIDPAPPVA